MQQSYIYFYPQIIHKLRIENRDVLNYACGPRQREKLVQNAEPLLWRGAGACFRLLARIEPRSEKTGLSTKQRTTRLSLVQVCYIVCLLVDNVDVKTEANKEQVKWASRSNGVSNEVHQGSSGRRVDRWNFRAFVCNSFPSIKI